MLILLSKLKLIKSKLLLKNKGRQLFIVACLFFILSSVSLADTYSINTKESALTCSIKYALIGIYKASFQKFSGVIDYNPKDFTKSSVSLEIDLNSIKSEYPALDRIVKSSRILNVKKYPKAYFKSTSVKKVQDYFEVKGQLQLHKLTKEFKFPFTLKLLGPIKSGKFDHLQAKGKWLINRKDFEIVWNKWLDQGGIVVGDQITVDWQVSAY